MQGISAAQFVRDATIVRLAFLAGRRGDSEARAVHGGDRRTRGAPATERARAERRARTRRACANCAARMLLDSPAEESFDRLTRLTSTVLNVPVALVSLVDR